MYSTYYFQKTLDTTFHDLDSLQSVFLSFLYRNNTLLDTKLGREGQEGLGRDDMVAHEKRNGLQTLLFHLGTSSGVKCNLINQLLFVTQKAIKIYLIFSGVTQVDL